MSHLLREVGTAYLCGAGSIDLKQLLVCCACCRAGQRALELARAVAETVPEAVGVVDKLVLLQYETDSKRPADKPNSPRQEAGCIRWFVVAVRAPRCRPARARLWSACARTALARTHAPEERCRSS